MMDFTAGLPNKHEGSHKTSPHKSRAGLGMLIALISVSVVAVGSTATATIFFVKYNNLKNNPSAYQQEDKQKIIDKVGKLYDVPNEDPSLARVTNVEKLKKEQEFFKNAKEGDYVLVYPKAKLGILYRESSNKIVNIGPVSTEQESTSGTPNGTSTADETQDQ